MEDALRIVIGRQKHAEAEEYLSAWVGACIIAWIIPRRVDIKAPIGGIRAAILLVCIKLKRENRLGGKRRQFSRCIETRIADEASIRIERPLAIQPANMRGVIATADLFCSGQSGRAGLRISPAQLRGEQQR